MQFSARVAGLALIALCPLASGPAGRPGPATRPAQAAAAAPFTLPCDGYRRGLRGKGGFGGLVTGRDTVFSGSHHLGEDVWLPPGTEVRSVAAGIVRYSDFSPSWKDAAGVMHWNLGNVVVVEHPLAPPVDGLSAVCSIYMHLAADRRVRVGEAVGPGQVLGRIGQDRSEENGRYPAHLHFGLHRGPYFQIPPAWRRDLEAAARGPGIVVPEGPPLRGEIELVLQSESSVLVRAREGGGGLLLSLLVGSTAPGKRPADIMSWCSGYGPRDTLAEWLCPSEWIEARAAGAQSAPATRTSASRPGR